MKLSQSLMVLGLVAGASGLLGLQACGGDSADTTDDAGVNGDSGGTGGPGRRWPDVPEGAGPTTSTEKRNFALKTLTLGEGNAWKTLGFDIDGKSTTKDSTDVCKPPVSGASQADGEEGIDNSFGQNVLPLITAAVSGAGEALNTALQSGNFTIMFNTQGLSDDPAQSATGLNGYVLLGAKFDGTPTFTTADDWPVRQELLSNPADATSSTIKFSNSYVADGTFVSGTPSEVKISLVFQGIALELTLRKAVITFKHASPNSATNGVLAGVINTEELLTGLKKVAGAISPGLCSGPSFDTIAEQIKAASDIMSDGSNSAGSTCDAISAAIGFTAEAIGQPSTVAEKGEEPGDPCAQ